MIFRGDNGFSKHLQAGNPAMFCFPIADTLPLNSPAITLTPRKRRGRQEQAARIIVVLQVLDALAAAAFSHCCWIIQSLLPKSELNLAAAALPAAEQMLVDVQVEVVPKLKLHLSEFFLAAGVKPGVQVRIGDGFKLFV